MNGWWKKYNSTVISTIIVIISLIVSTVALASTMRADIDNLKATDARYEKQLEYQEECYDDVNYKLGQISGQLETLIKLNKSGGG